METQDETTEELSIRDSIASAIKEVEGPEEPTEPTPKAEEGEALAEEPQEQAASSDTERARGPDGKFIKKDNAEAAPELAAPADVTPEADKPLASSTGAPSSWNEQGRALYAKADPTLQAYIRQRESEQLKGVADLKQQYEAKSNFADEMWKEIAPYQHMIQAEGGTPAAAVKDLLGMAALMRTGAPDQKRQLLLDTAQQFGVDLGTAKPDETRQADPTVDALQREVGTLKQTLGSLQQQTAEQQRSTLLTEIEQFKADKPHFEAVQKTMVQLISSGIATGLQDAYDQAIRLNPDIWNQMEQERTAAAEVERQKALREKAEKAKQASGSVTGAPGVASPGDGPAGSIREELTRAMNGSRV